jgi:hypothetical protein
MNRARMMTYREPRDDAAREGEAEITNDDHANIAVDGVNVQSVRTLPNGYTALVLVDNKTTYVITREFLQITVR